MKGFTTAAFLPLFILSQMALRARMHALTVHMPDMHSAARLADPGCSG